MVEYSHSSFDQGLNRDADGKIESATGTAETRVRQQLSWLSRLPADFTTVLDVGAGAGYHSKYFLDQGKKPTALERYADAFQFKRDIPLIAEDLLDLQTNERFDAVFCSHVLEHFPDPASAIQKMRSLLKPDGYLFIVVPPYEPLVVNYHWHTGWNCSQLAMLLAALGFDCSEATFMEIEGNVCGWGRKREVPNTKFNLRRSLPFLPAGMSETFFVKDGYDFLPGRLIFADPNAARIAGDAVRFSVPAFSFQDERQLKFEEQSWQSIEARFSENKLNLAWGCLSVFIAVEGEAPTLRIAVGHGTPDNPWQNCGEYYLSVSAGMSCFHVKPGDFSFLRGEINFTRIESVSIGGFGTHAQVRVWCYGADGSSVLP